MNGLTYYFINSIMDNFTSMNLLHTKMKCVPRHRPCLLLSSSRQSGFSFLLPVAGAQMKLGCQDRLLCCAGWETALGGWRGRPCSSAGPRPPTKASAGCRALVGLSALLGLFSEAQSPGGREVNRLARLLHCEGLGGLTRCLGS